LLKCALLHCHTQSIHIQLRSFLDPHAFLSLILRLEDTMCPRSHTCFNRIDLPVFNTYADLKLTMSIVIDMESAGFTLP
jgi:hypothetical protein